MPHKMTIFGGKKPHVVRWDSDNPPEVTTARAVFNEHRRAMVAFKETPAGYEAVSSFDPHTDIVLQPGLNGG